MSQYNMGPYNSSTGATLVQMWNDVVPSTGGEVVVSGTAVVTETATLSSVAGTPMSLRVYPGDLVQPASGVTLTIDAPIRAGRWPVFDLSQGGTVLLGPSAASEVRPEWFGAVGDGKTDDTAALQAMAAALPAGARVLLSATYRIVYNGSTTSTPALWSASDTPTIAILITQPNVWVVGEGGAEVCMDGFCFDTACQYGDWAGLDRYTAISFSNTSGGGVTGVRFTGNGQGQPLLLPTAIDGCPFASRAKGVGIQDSSNVTVRDVSGFKLVGNVVNARGDTGPTATQYIQVTGCFASTCCENGFNYMGGTSNCIFSGNISTGNGFSGFETGTVNVACMGNLCYGNQMHGINHVGQYGTFVGNTLLNNMKEGFVFQGGTTPPRGEQSVVASNVVCGNQAAGIVAASGSTGNLLSGNYLLDNGPVAGALGIELTDGGVTDFVISGNVIADTRAGLSGASGVMATDVTNLNLIGNSFNMTAGNSLSASGGANQAYVANVASQPSSVTGVTHSVSRGNVGF